jgi:hypothetical protein
LEGHIKILTVILKSVTQFASEHAHLSAIAAENSYWNMTELLETLAERLQLNCKIASRLLKMLL